MNTVQFQNAMCLKHGNTYGQLSCLVCDRDELLSALESAVSWQRGPFAGAKDIQIPAWLERAEAVITKAKGGR